MGYSYAAIDSLIADFDFDANTGRNMEEAVWEPSLNIHVASIEVPEPASYLLVMMGLAMLMMVAGHKKQ